MNKQDYQSPTLAPIGTLHEMTLVNINKSGGGTDGLTGQVVGGVPIGGGSVVVITP